MNLTMTGKVVGKQPREGCSSVVVPITEDLPGAGEMAQQTSVPAALAKAQGLDLSTNHHL